MMPAYTLVGSRKTPSTILLEATKIGIWISQQQHFARSGHAEGFDWAAEQGAAKFCDVFLPWLGFNKHLPMLGTPVVVKSTEAHEALVRKYHPAPDRLSKWAFDLMARNSCQVLGEDLESPSLATVCWCPGDRGGTGQAVRISEGFGIPVIRMHLSEFATAELVIAELERILESKELYSKPPEPP